MDREILFRGRTIKTRFGGGKWIEGFFVMSCAGRAEMEPAIITGTEKGCFMTEFVDPTTVGQFTGLCDKNGVKIFEGDILVSNRWACPCHVSFIDGGFTLEEGETAENLGANFYDCEGDEIEDIQIIGNIHDTPDLGLKEESE